MEEKINIAAILKDKKNGLRLYSPIFGECAFCSVRKDTNDICVKKHNGVKEFFDSKGLYYNTGEVMLFPSKSMRDWEKFSWKNGDVLKNTAYEERVIFDGFLNDDYTYFKGKHPLDCSDKFNISYHEECNCFTGNYRLESTDAAQTYINDIEERLGGKLNSDTLEIEKTQPEFKDGDIVVYGKSVAICRKFYKHTLCFYVSLNDMFGLLFNDEVESSEEYRFATEEEKQQLFSALKKEGKAWDSEKKAIVDLKPKVELKPFDKVLVRSGREFNWYPALFVRDRGDNYEKRYIALPIHIGTAADFASCIPFEGHENIAFTNYDIENLPF